MASKTWTLTDVEQGTFVEQLAVLPDDVDGPARGYSIAKRTLRGGLCDGVDLIEVDNGTLRFAAIPTRGMGIWKAGLGDLQLGWNSPVAGPVHPGLVRLWEPSGIGWLDGFDELFVRCGLESNGAPEFNEKGDLLYPLHGKIANIPAGKVELSVDGDSGKITLTGRVDESRLFGNKLQMVSTITTEAGQPSLTVTDRISNPSAEPSELELLYHVNFGAPLLDHGSKVVLPTAKVAPRDSVAVDNVSEWDTYGPETPGSIESVFFFDLAADADGRTQAVLRNRAGDRGVVLRFNKSELPCFTLWKNRQAASDGYVTGLEPGINFPNPKSFEKANGRVAVLEPGESRTFQIEMEALPDPSAVEAAEAAVAELLGGRAPHVLGQPDPDWSA